MKMVKYIMRKKGMTHGIEIIMIKERVKKLERMRVQKKGWIGMRAKV
jgi:hypothetical protein